MKKQKAIVIKNPLLMNLRNNLRLIIALVVYGKKKDLREMIRKLDHIGKYDDGEFPTKAEEQESGRLTKIENNLGFSLYRSICHCNMCQKMDKDMVFFPPFSEWFCIGCYNAHHEGWIESIEAQDK